jgi:5-formyltetrahydrofolate cyclo-ligase
VRSPGGEKLDMGDKNSQEDTMASTAALKAAKKELRSLMKHKLSAISRESIDRQSSFVPASLKFFNWCAPGSAVFKTITDFKPYQEAKRIGIYLSMPAAELQTDALVRHALGAGKQVFVPYLFKRSDPPPDTPKSVMDMVDLRSLSDYDSLKRDSWGIPTIGADTVHHREHVLSKESLPLDMILMPGVAFDIDRKSGFIRRLGHGKGFYDYFLHRYVARQGSEKKKLEMGPETDALLYGLAFEEQYLEPDAGPSVPVGEHDNPLHGLFVGNGKRLEGPLVRE